MLSDIALDRSNPRSPRWGKWLKNEEIRDLIAPQPSAIDAVVQFCTKELQGKSKVVFTRDFVICDSNAASIGSGFATEMREYVHRRSSRPIIRALRSKRPVLPASVAAHVDVIEGLSDFFEYPTDKKDVYHTRAKKQTSKSTTEPYIMPIRGSEKHVLVPVTANCGDATPVISSFVLTFKDESGRDYRILGSSATGAATTESPLVFDLLFNTGGPAAWRRVYDIMVTQVCSNGAITTANYLQFHQPAPWVTPAFLSELYGVPGDAVITQKASQAVTAFEAQYFSVTDLQTYDNYAGRVYIPPTVVGPNDVTNPGGEATLDIQWVRGMAKGANTTFWSVGGSGPAKGAAYILTWAMEVADAVDPPLVTSISYGDTEQGYYQKFGNYSYIDRMEAELTKMAARGLTVVAGSGDAGATNVGEQGNDISDPDPDCTVMRPFYPSNSHWVVSVSATLPTKYSTPGCQASYPVSGAAVAAVDCDELGESAVGLSQGTFWTTGGGFSGYLSRPVWQQRAVSQYLLRVQGNEILPLNGTWNPNGRAYPDVSAVGFNLECVLGGKVVPIGGTSASGPVIAALLTRLNDLRLASGLSPIGPPHQLLYGLAAAPSKYFNDIVVGDNRDGDWQPPGSVYPSKCQHGYPTAPGWDAVSGLGTPLFAAWAKAAVAGLP